MTQELAIAEPGEVQQDQLDATLCQRCGQKKHRARCFAQKVAAHQLRLRGPDDVHLVATDPIIGKIFGPGKRWSRKEVSFLIAWHLDLRVL